MQVPCPECDTRFEAAPDAEVVCPACMNTFQSPKAPVARALALLPDDAPAPAEGAVGGGLLSELSSRVWEVQTAEGGVIHNLSRYAVREGIYTEKLANSSKVRRADGTWEALGAVQEFAAVFKLIGVDPLPAPATRKIAGWKGERAEEERPAERPVRRTETAEKPDQSRLLAIGGGVLLILLLGAVYLATR